MGLETTDAGTELGRSLLKFLEGNWERPDEGIWEVRGPRRHFTHSKVMAWVAFDRAVRAVEHSSSCGRRDLHLVEAIRLHETTAPEHLAAVFRSRI